MNKYHWEEDSRIDADAVRRLTEAFDIPDAGARFLVARAMTTPEEASAYLFADDIQPHDPFLFNNMDRAVSAIQKSITSGERVLIHGDYDVDGICGTALLYEYLRDLVPDVYRFLPDRRKDGYGVAERAVEWALANDIGLVIAVDCGTADGDKVARLEEAGITVVVCDHHEFPVDREARGIVLNPVGKDEAYPFKGLCGTGVALKLVTALHSRGVVGETTPDALLDLAALATVGDVAPLTDENRLFVRAGLRSISDSRRPGLRELKAITRLDAPEVTAWHVGFVLGPRINAPGRIANPKPSLEILCTTDKAESKRLAAVLESNNRERKEQTEAVTNDVITQILDMNDRQERGGFVLAGKDWHEGVLGIAAARVVEEFGRPALLITGTEGLAKGSGRSVRGVHLKEQLDQCKSYLARYGGHAQAVGLSIEPSKIEEFASALSATLKTAMAALPKQPLLRIDAELAIADCSMELIDFLSTCEPFGHGNRAPVWKIPNVEITSDTRIVGKGHLKLHVRDQSGKRAEAISFNWSRGSKELEALYGKTVDLAATVRKGYFRKKYSPEIHVRDMREVG